MNTFIGHAFIYAGAIAWEILMYYDESKGKNIENQNNKYRPFIYGQNIPFAMLIMILGAILLFGKDSIYYFYDLCFKIFPIISIYYALLIGFSSYLRKHLQRRTVVILWLIPSFLAMIVFYSNIATFPLFILHVNEKVLSILLIIWAIGFIAILIYHNITHLMFRKKILKFSTEIHDETVLTIWKEELSLANNKKRKLKNYPLYKCELLNSPLSVGMFDKAIFVVLPHINYNEDQIRLILRHEILHIARCDVGSKFFITFIKALCWYNPFMWIAMRKCSEDIELSCDEATIANEDETLHKLYINTILTSADTETGYTSCLSAKVSSLQYRLTNILIPKEKRRGAFLVGTIFFVLCLSCNIFALTYGNYNGLDLINDQYEIKQHTNLQVEEGTNYVFPTYIDIDLKTFQSYMKKIELQKINYIYDFSKNKSIYIRLKNENTNDNLLIIVNDNFVKIGSDYYYSKDEILFDEFTRKKPHGNSLRD